jgi:hypothetical protein
VLGRDVKVKVPMAETTLENMAKIMPGATLVETGAAAATGTLTLPVGSADRRPDHRPQRPFR